MPAPITTLVAALLSALAALRARRRNAPVRAMVVSPRTSNRKRDGAVLSVQSAELTMTPPELERLWSPTNLENLGRTYWRFLSRVTLGLVRVIYGPHERLVVLVGRPLTLLRFDLPEYVLESDHGRVSWRIRDGLLVARAGRGCGFLSLDIRRLRAWSEQDAGFARHASAGLARVRIEVEVANFYPAIAAGFSMPVYEATQSYLHVLVTQAFLRSLSTLELAQSKVGRLAAKDAPRDPARPAQL